jgi:hypothetical protein
MDALVILVLLVALAALTPGLSADSRAGRGR